MQVYVPLSEAPPQGGIYLIYRFFFLNTELFDYWQNPFI